MAEGQQIRVADLLATAEALYGRLESKVHQLEEHHQNEEVQALLQFIERRTHLVGGTIHAAREGHTNCALESWMVYHRSSPPPTSSRSWRSTTTSLPTS